MLEAIKEHLQWLYDQQGELCSLLQSWCAISSGSDQLDGLTAMCASLDKAFTAIGGQSTTIALPPRLALDNRGFIVQNPCGSVLHVKKQRKNTPVVLLAGHMDTVFDATSYQPPVLLSDGVLRGSGCADMKGGLVIMLKALEALERSPWANKLSWEVIIVPDEEVGSPGSQHFLQERAKHCHVGLVFEPSLRDGSLVSARKGSANIGVIAKGRALHAGRDFDADCNAVTTLARYIAFADQLNRTLPDVTVNVGVAQGGSAANVVPERAYCLINLRSWNQNLLDEALLQLQQEAKQPHGKVSLSIVELSHRLPKPFDQVTEALFNAFKICADNLTIPLSWHPSGGVCDGNVLAAAGIPTIDSLGVIGGDIHTAQEWVLLDSLSQRAALTAYFLLALAAGELPLTHIIPKESCNVTS